MDSPIHQRRWKQAHTDRLSPERHSRPTNIEKEKQAQIRWRIRNLQKQENKQHDSDEDAGAPSGEHDDHDHFLLHPSDEIRWLGKCSVEVPREPFSNLPNIRQEIFAAEMEVQTPRKPRSFNDNLVKTPWEAKQNIKEASELILASMKMLEFFKAIAGEHTDIDRDHEKQGRFWSSRQFGLRIQSTTPPFFIHDNAKPKVVNSDDCHNDSASSHQTSKSIPPNPDSDDHDHNIQNVEVVSPLEATVTSSELDSVSSTVNPSVHQFSGSRSVNKCNSDDRGVLDTALLSHIHIDEVGSPLEATVISLALWLG